MRQSWVELGRSEQNGNRSQNDTPAIDPNCAGHRGRLGEMRPRWVWDLLLLEAI
jgi:hypothetical protein